MIGRAAGIAAGMAIGLITGAEAAPYDLATFFADVAKLDGHMLAIRSSNGPVPPGMTAQLHVDGPHDFSVATTTTDADGTPKPFAQEIYRFEPDLPGLTSGHFRTEFNRTNGSRKVPLICDSFLFLAQSLQMDCYSPQNFRLERQAYRLEFTVVWDLRPDLFNIRILSSDGVANLSTPR
jgi:hypothetical protein